MTFGSTFGRVFSPSFQPKSQAAAGGTYTFSPVADTYVVSIGSYQNTNYGSSSEVSVNTPNVKKGLFRFDLSTIPAAATCTAATLTVKCASTNNSGRYFLIYEIASANGDWTETGATWNSRYSGTSWVGSAGLSTEGTDYVNTLIAESAGTTIEANNPIAIVFNASGLAVVKSWFGQATNSGIAIWYNVGASMGIYSKEASTESYRPTLTVTYS